MSKLVYVGGIPGVGKTTICSELCKQLSQCVYVSSGEFKRVESRKRYGKNLSSLNQEESYQINKWFFEEPIEELTRNKEFIFVIDTHYTYTHPENIGEFVNLCPDEVIPALDLLVLFEVNPEEVIERRINRGRDRDSINKSQVYLEYKAEMEEAKRISITYEKPLRIISTLPEKKNVIKEFKKTLETYFISA